MGTCTCPSNVVVDTDADALAAAGEDFGRIVFNTPGGVVTPSSISDLRDAVEYAYCEGLTIAPQGATHSLQGQAQILDGTGIALNMSLLNDIDLDDDDYYVWVEAGTIWRELLEATLAVGKTPPVFTDYIELSVGGTLSVGGIGSQTFRTGLQIDNVLELKVVKPNGKIEKCSADDDADLFYGALAGYGQFGVIAAAKLPLVDAKPNTRYVKLLYVDYDDFVDDMFTLINGDRFDGVQGFALVNTFDGVSQGSGFSFFTGPIGTNDWLYMIEGTVYFGEYNLDSDDDDDDDDDDSGSSDPPTMASLLEGLSYYDSAYSDISYFDYINRVAATEAFLRSINAWFVPHPWIDVYYPRSAASDIQYELENNFPPAAVGGGPVLIYPCLASAFNSPNYPIPNDANGEFLLFGMLRSSASPATALAENAALYQRVVLAGGTGYAIDAIPLNPAGWEAHFGSARYAELEDLKATYDPDNLFSPGQNMF